MTRPRAVRAGDVRRRRRRRGALLHPAVARVDDKDVTLLRTFLSDRGRIRSRRVTGLTPQQQRAVTRAVKNAREMALLPYATHHRRSS